MYLFLCLSENNGLAFNNRHQSSDIAVTRDIVNTVGAGKLYIKPYSVGLFADENTDLIVTEDVFCAGAEDYAFSELDAPVGCEDEIDGLTVYRWNRDYPADTFFRMDLSPFELVSEEKFSGKSHPEITKCIYKRV